MSEASRRKFLFLPPLMRFIVEFTTWIWLLLAAIFIHYGFAFLLAFSVLSLALINALGDKRSADSRNLGPSIPGWVRVSVEVLSAILGMFGAFYFGQYIFIGFVVLLIQLSITLFSFLLDFKRWMWLLGRKDHAPKYVTKVHKS